MKYVISFKRVWLVLLVPFTAILTYLGRLYPAATERLFSQGLYRIIAYCYGHIFGLLPFSAAQFMIILLPVILVLYLFFVIMRIIKYPKTRKKGIVRLFVNIMCVISVTWFLFMMLCGLNYARVSYAEVSGLEIRHSSAAELVDLCEELAIQVNASSACVARNEEGRMYPSAGNYYALARQARAAFQAAAEEYPVLAGFCPLPKPVLYSRLMSHVNISGIYIPFTMEANVNVDISDYAIPAIMNHEIAHFKGFMREDEANFIAYLTCKSSGSPDFVYSGDMLAFVYAANQLRSVSNTDYRRIMSGLADGAILDLQANNAYWKQFEGPMAEFSKSVNDAYLKSNQQFDGIKSYGRMVDLLLADYRMRH